jgi:hypothetical protein
MAIWPRFAGIIFEDGIQTVGRAEEIDVDRLGELVRREMLRFDRLMSAGVETARSIGPSSAGIFSTVSALLAASITSSGKKWIKPAAPIAFSAKSYNPASPPALAAMRSPPLARLRASARPAPAIQTTPPFQPAPLIRTSSPN